MCHPRSSSGLAHLLHFFQITKTQLSSLEGKERLRDGTLEWRCHGGVEVSTVSSLDVILSLGVILHSRRVPSMEEEASR